jgi:hypothetical protein
VSEMRAIIGDAHALVHGQAGFVVDPKAAQAADDFLSAAEALADPTALRRPDGTSSRRLSLRSTGRKPSGTTTNRSSRPGALERHRAGRARTRLRNRGIGPARSCVGAEGRSLRRPHGSQPPGDYGDSLLDYGLQRQFT